MSNIMIMNDMLKEMRVKSNYVLSGADAITSIENRLALAEEGKGEMYKLVLLDYNMPEMDGPAVAKRIHELFRSNSLLLSTTDTKDRPYIVCCSAYEADEIIKSALDAGMDQFLSKPLNFKSLAQICKTHVT